MMRKKAACELQVRDSGEGGLNGWIFSCWYFSFFQWKRISRKPDMQLKNCLEEISFRNRNEV